MSIDLGFSKSKEKSTSKESLEQIVSNSGSSTEELEISDEAIDKIVQDVLGGVNGLAGIFGAEQTSGIFNSSVAAQEAGDLTANLVGEIARLRAKKKTTNESEQETNLDRSASGTGSQSGFTAGGSFDANKAISALGGG